uniref:ESPR-type extended signal peptide-containing protein n=1 Tax=Acinetobacter seifertii TaxID=1530123 RepID=UPI001BADFA82|nr:ESPR-type extended signal peptide-containing protein [Acinetobacter seifertii]
MNKIYKVIWNASLGIWVAVSEIAKGKTKNCSGVASSTNELIVDDETSESKRFEYKVLVLAILGVITPSAFAGYEAGGGSTFTNCTSTSAGSGSRSAGSVAIGTSATATTPTSGQACAPTKDSIAIGLSASTAGAAGNNQSIAIGRESAASGDQAIALGANVKASGNSSVAIGGDDVDKVVDSDGALYTTITGGTIVKNNYIPTESSGAASTAMGVQAKASGAFSTALGMTSAATGPASVALGVNSTATGQGALAIGAVSNAQDNGTIAVGINSKAVGNNSIAIGSGNTSTTGANTTGPNATSIGSNASAVVDSTAIGSGAKANVSGGVAIGKDSVANTAAGVAGFDPITGTTSTQTTNVWKSTQGVIALGDAANNVTRQLTGLAAGTNDSDAVNVAQLKTVTNQTFKLQANGDVASAVKTSDTVQFLDGKNINITRSGNNITVQTVDTPTFTSVTTGNSKLDNSGLNITGGPSVTTAGINAGNQKITNVKAGTNATDAVNFSQLNATNQNVTTAQNTANTALTNAAAAQATADKGLNFSVNGGTTDNVKLGETVNFADGTNTTAEYDPATNTYKYSVNDNIALTNAGSLTVGNTKVDDSGLTITGGPSITTAGINAANQKITNVAAGTISSTSTDAVNGSQLNATNQNVTTAQNTANTAVTNAAAAQNTANTAVTNAAAAQATADKGLNFSVNGGTADNVKLGETVNFANGTNTTATYDPATNTYKYNVNDNIALTNAGSLTVGNTKVDNSGLNITGGPSVTTAGINAGNQKITNVKAGINATDAVNFSQLNATNQNVTTAQNTANTALTNAAAAQATADKGLNFSVNGGTTDNVKLGETVNFADGTNTTVEYDPAINTYKYNVNDNIALTNAGSLTVGNTKVDNSGLSITGGPSVTTAGINAANQKITNVAAGTNATDAVNVSQLGAITTAANTKTDALGTSIASNLGGGAVYNPVTGAVSSPIYTVNGNNVNNVGAAISALDKGWTLQSNGTNAGTVKVGDTVDIGTVAGESNLKVTKTGNNIQYGLNRDLNIDSVTAGDSKLDTNGLTITGGPSVTSAGINAGNQKVTNVAAGTISSTSTDAVNGSQLDATNQNVMTAQNTANTAVTNAAAAQATADKGLNFSVNGGTAKNVKLGETVNFADGTNTTATYDPATNTYKYNVNDNIVLTNAGSLTVGNTKVDNSGLSIAGGPSVTITGINAANQKVTNVAAGTISATSTDAVNGSQLNATNQNVTTAQNTANTAVTNAAAAQATADKGLNFSVNGSTADNVKLGETVNFADGTNTTAVYDPAANTYKYNVNDNIALTNAGSLTVGNTKIDNSGLTITGGPSVTTAGINAANQKITNVAAGTNATDAVNVSQLGAITTAANTKTDALGISTASNLGGGAVYNPVTGAVSSPVYSVNGSNLNNVGDAITALDKGWTLQSNGDNAGVVKAGDTVDIGTVAGESNLKVTKTGNKIQYGLNRDLNIDSVTAGDSKLDTNGLTIAGGPSVTKSGIDAANQKITNVGAGSISATSTDAVNGSQLNATNQNVTTAQNTANTAVTSAAAAQATADKGLNFSVNGGTAKNVKLGETINFADGTNTTAVYDPATNTYKYNVNDNIALTNAGNLTVGNTKVDNSGLTITGGPSVTTAGMNAGNQKITNVAAGTNATDAVNVSQLGAITTAANSKTDALGTSTASNLGGGAVYNPVTGAVSSPVYSVNGSNLNNVGDAITALDKGWTLQSNGDNAGVVKAGDTVDIGTVAGESNLKVTKTGNNIQYGLNRDLNIDSVTAGDSKLDTNGLTIAGGPSVTQSGIDAANQKITNVGAGSISATSTDAVNGSQLHTLDSRVTKNGDSTANIFGGGAKANPDGSISNPTYTVAGTSANNVGDALTALDKAVNDAGTAANAGWTVSANGDAATAKKIKPNGKVNFTGDDNLTVAQSSETDNEGNIKVALNKKLKVDSVTTGNTVIDTIGVKVGDNVQLGSTGLIIAGGPSITASGINAGNKVITNVAAGVNTTDAVNKGQLDSAITNINNNVGALANSAVQYDKNADGTVNKDSVTLAGGANGTALKNVANGTVAESSKDAVNGGQLWSVQQQVDKNTGDISNLQSNINNGKTGLVQQADKDAAITVGKDTGGTQVNVGGTAGDRTVTGVKVGAVTTSSKDAVNGSQLNTTNQALVSALGGGAGYNNITESFSNPTYNVADKSYNNVGDALGALNQADQTLNTKIDNVNNKLEQAFYATNQRIDNLEEKMSAGIAANAALENAPFIAGKVTMAVGAAYYNQQNAVGVTLRKTADNGRWSLTTGAALGSQGSPLVRVGVSTVID